LPLAPHPCGAGVYYDEFFIFHSDSILTFIVVKVKQKITNYLMIFGWSAGGTPKEGGTCAMVHVDRGKEPGKERCVYEE